jgi:hypothetical protein
MDHFRTTWWLLALLALLLSGPLLTLAFGSVSMRGDWRTATHRATGLAPDPSTYREAVVQVYASRTFGWRGAFAVHTWLAAKPKDATRYTRYEVIGWYAMRGGSALSISDRGAPDAEWYGAPPWLVRDVRGADAQAIIDKLPAAASSYPYAASYTMWPGPNSNTFIAHLGRELPELRLTMPSMAIGKDYLPAGHLFARAPSGDRLSNVTVRRARSNRRYRRRPRSQLARSRDRHRLPSSRHQASRHRQVAGQQLTISKQRNRWVRA